MFDGWRPRAVVFDCDGLLVDSERCWTLAETELFAARGARFGPEDEVALIGGSVPEACALMAQALGDGSSGEEVQAELTVRVREIVAREGGPMPGAGEVLALLVGRLPTAIASNSPRTLLDQALSVGRFARLPAVTVAADEVVHPKPAPDLYLAACARLGMSPGDCLAMEDSATGIRAAAAAGLRTVGVPTLTGTDIGAEVTLSSLQDPGLMAFLSDSLA